MHSVLSGSFSLAPLAFVRRSHVKLCSVIVDPAILRMPSQILPFKFSYRAISFASRKRIPFSNSELCGQRFSTWPVRRPRPDGGNVRSSKSLIEDEAELSDWVSELNSGLNSKRRLGNDDDYESKSRSKDTNVEGRKKFESRNSVVSKRQKTPRAGMYRDDDKEEDDYGRKKNFGRSTNCGRQENRIKNLNQRGRIPREKLLTVSNDEDDMEESDDYDSDDDRIRSKKKSFQRSTLSPGRDNGSSRRKEKCFENLKKHRMVSRTDLITISDDEGNSEESDEEPRDGDKFRDLRREQDKNDEKNDNYHRSLQTSPSRSDSYLSETRFDECPISPLSLKAIKEAGFEKMTLVQEATLPVILKGKDVLAKAKTGTGKTVAFLLPSIEIILKSPSFDRDQRNPPITVLVICPTRELAVQAATEAQKLLKHHPSIGVQVVIGGIRPSAEQKRLQDEPCQILVATPGRLKDHIENTMGFATRLKGLKVLALDEADRLLDMGFRPVIEGIIAAVPKQRQTLLFSATVPPEVRQICHIALKRDHEFINTVEEGSEETHAQVKQMHMVAPLDKHFSSLYAILTEHIAGDDDYKVIVFCTTTKVTSLVADLLRGLHLNVREIHSRKPQNYRTRISDEFRNSKGLILVTSDVSARGVDYPNVTLVVQVGLPSDRQQYIHRLGRTGRKGKEGQGVLILAPWEDFFLSSIKDVPISKASIPTIDLDTKKKVERALSNVDMKHKESAYQSWLGYYNSKKEVGRDKSRLVELANEFSKSMGLSIPPAVSKRILGKMGLKNVPGLRECT